MQHVLIGTNDEDYRAIVQAADGNGFVGEWVVPKSSLIGDEVVLYIRSKGFVATGLIASKPKPGMFRKRHVYRAPIGKVRLLTQSVPLQFVASAIPTWAWATYPRTYTTPPPDTALRLSEVLDEYQSGIADEPDEVGGLTEGRVYRMEVRRRERNAKARGICISHYEARCAACGFEFGS